MVSYKLYTDGACPGKPGPGVGGTGVYVTISGEFGEREVKDLRGYHQTTNNRMEMRAGISGLELIRKLRKEYGWGRCEWFTDSEYIADNLSNVKNWKKETTWTRSDGQPVLNEDLWRKLDSLSTSLGIFPAWIPREENTVADNLAKKAAKSPTHTDFGFSVGRVGTSKSKSRRGPDFFDSDSDCLHVRIYKGDGQVSKGIYKVRFQIFDKTGHLSEDKLFVYTNSMEVYLNLHRHYEYKLVIKEGYIFKILWTNYKD